MVSKVFLHIGQEKTGTTSIQEFLHANRSKLAEEGVFVPQSIGHKNHKALAAYALPAGSRDIAAMSVRGDTTGESEGKVAAFRVKTESALTHEVAKRDYSVAILSSEDLSRLSSAEDVERCLSLVRKISQNVKIVVFVRRQDLLASSRYYSLVLGGYKGTSILPREQPAKTSYYQYAHKIGLWIDAVGPESVILRRFPECPLSESFSSVPAFAAIAGLDATQYEQVKPQHVSLDAVNQIVMQNYNVMRGQYDAKGLEALMAHLAPYNEKRFAHIPSAMQAEKFYSRFREANNALFTRLGREDQMFSEDFSMYQAENMRAAFQSRAIRRLMRVLASQDLLNI